MRNKTLITNNYFPKHAGDNASLRARFRIGTMVTVLVLIIFAASQPAVAADEKPASYANEQYYDPFEPVNRVFFRFNQIFDEVLLKPIARLYIMVVPDGGRVIVSNVINNLKSPVILANDLLQGDLDRAQTTIARFATNSIIGFGGMGDVAADLGAAPHSEDFGQTLAVHGVSKGPYVMLPFLGPSTVRDAIGQFVDTFFDPLGYVLSSEEAIARAGIEGLDKRANYLDVSEALEKTSIDYYASIRSVFLQNRAYEIRNGVPEPIVDIYGDTPDSGN